MQITSNAVQTAPTGKSAAAGGRGADQAAAGAFGDLLIATIGAPTSNTPASDSGAASLLGELRTLLAGLTGQGQTAEESVQRSETELDPEGLDKLLESKLEDLLGEDAFTQWLEQAAALQAAMAGPADNAAATGQLNEMNTAEEGIPVSGPASVKPAAGSVTSQFLQALSAEPDNPFLQQLAGKLNQLLLQADGVPTEQEGSLEDALQGLDKPLGKPADGPGSGQPIARKEIAEHVPGADSSSADSEPTMSVTKAPASMLLARLEAIGHRQMAAQGASQTAEADAAAEPTAGADHVNSQVNVLDAGIKPEGRPVLPTVKPDGTPVPIQQFAKELDAFLVKTFRTSGDGDFSVARLTLAPEHLGQVEIKITLHNGQLAAHFMTQSGMAKEMLEAQMAQLRTSLQSQGMQVDRLEVTQQTEASSFTFQEQGRQPREQASRQDSRSSQGSYEDETAIEAVELDAARWNTGGSFDTIA